jgi:hypothetical protein
MLLQPHRFKSVVASSQFLGRLTFQLTLTKDRLQPGNVSLHIPDAVVVLQLTNGQLEAQVEELLLHIVKPDSHFIVR